MQVALPTTSPALFVALSRLLHAALGSSSGAAASDVCKLSAALQADVVEGESGRLAALSAARCATLLCICTQLWPQLAERLFKPHLLKLCVPGAARGQMVAGHACTPTPPPATVFRHAVRCAQIPTMYPRVSVCMQR
jgi:hypothetical protein